MPSESRHASATAGFVSDNWPDAAWITDAEQRLALKLGLTLLWSGKLLRVAAAFDSTGHPRSVAEHERLRVRGVPPVVSLIRDFRAMLSDPATTIGFVGRGPRGWFNWTGRHIPDAERVHAWMSPSFYEEPALERRFSAGQIQEAELDTTMLLIGLILWEYEVGGDDPFQEISA